MFFWGYATWLSMERYLEQDNISSLRTLSSQDPAYQAFIDGSFSRTLRAIPCRCLDGRNKPSNITFHILPIKKIERPSIAKIWIKQLRLPYLTLTLNPIVAISLLLLSRGDMFSLNIAVSAFLALLFLQISTHLFNDYSDHISGRDRFSQKGGSRVIQKGWLAAYEVKRAALICFFLALICGSVILITKPILFFILGFIALFGILEFCCDHFRLRYRGFGEFIIFFLCGPFLTLTYEFLLIQQMEISVLALGIFFGVLALVAVHLEHLEEILPDSQWARKTITTLFGFETSRNLVIFFYMTALCGAFVAIKEPILRKSVIVMLIVFLGFMVFVMRKILIAHCFASSLLNNSRHKALQIHFWSGLILNLTLLLSFIFKI